MGRYYGQKIFQCKVENLKKFWQGPEARIFSTIFIFQLCIIQIFLIQLQRNSTLSNPTVGAGNFIGSDCTDQNIKVILTVRGQSPKKHHFRPKNTIFAVCKFLNLTNFMTLKVKKPPKCITGELQFVALLQDPLIESKSPAFLLDVF